MRRAAKDQKALTWIITTASGMVLLLVFTFFVTATKPTQRSEVASSAIETNTKAWGPVSVSGSVADVLGTRTFVLHSFGPLTEQILVISRDPLVPVGGGEGIDDFFFQTNDTVSLSGEIRPFNLRALEEELGVDLKDAVYRNWQGKSVIVAERVEKE